MLFDSEIPFVNPIYRLTVGSLVSAKLPSVNRFSKADLPTVESPTLRSGLAQDLF